MQQINNLAAKIGKFQGLINTVVPRGGESTDIEVSAVIDAVNGWKA